MGVIRKPLNYHYLSDGGPVIRIRSKVKPNKYMVPTSGTYIVNEYNPESKEWEMPCFPEITANCLFDKCKYLGSTSG